MMAATRNKFKPISRSRQLRLGESRLTSGSL
jgi:hypothetical protein